jgi:hypothetical protein
MLKNTAILASIGLALSASAQADYRWELGGDYSTGTTDTELKTPIGSFEEDNDAEVFRAYGTYYLEKVDTSKGPLGEAAFLDHASNFTLFGSDGDVEFSNFEDKDGQTYGASGRYVAAGPGWKLSGWLMDVGYERREPGEAEIDVYTIGIGNYITENTTLVVNYENVGVNNGGDTDGYSVDLEHMWLLSHGGIKANASYGVVTVKEADDTDVYVVGGTWYLNNNLGFGANYQHTSENGYEIDGYSVFSEWFINESVAVNLAYEEAQPDDIDFGNTTLETDISAVTLGALVRF